MSNIIGTLICCILMVGICLGIYVMDSDKLDDMWTSASFLGKILTCIYVVISLPGIVVYIFGSFIIFVFDKLHDLAFPRKSGWWINILYDANLAEELKNNKIYFEHNRQFHLETSVITFCWKKDYEKALRLFPNIQDRIVNYYK